MKSNILILTKVDWVKYLMPLVMLTSCKNNGSDLEEPKSDGQTRVYEESFESFPNPERGFLHLNAVFSEGSPLSQSSLNQLRADNISLVWRLYYFDQFKNQDLSQAELDLIETDMNNIRSAGLKCVLRFAYTDNSDDGTDAPIEWVERHLDQLQPIFESNADVIAFLNAGFIGLWGEWHSSTNDLTSLENQKRIVNKLLDVLPITIKIQLRTPKQKRDIFGISTALTDEIGYSFEDIARVGHHNDCFMASPNDYGTYQNPIIDKNYISQEALYVPTGGETCPPSGVEPADCAVAEETMSLLKWSYLNLDWYKPIIDSWKSEGCFEEFKRHMGYRLRLDSTISNNTAAQNKEWSIQIALSNVGWAPIYNQKNVSIVLISAESKDKTGFPVDVDLRKVAPATSVMISKVFDISTLEIGEYEVYLKIADQYQSLQDRPEYSIRLANTDIWDDTNGLNDLQRSLMINR